MYKLLSVEGETHYSCRCNAGYNAAQRQTLASVVLGGHKPLQGVSSVPSCLRRVLRLLSLVPMAQLENSAELLLGFPEEYSRDRFRGWLVQVSSPYIVIFFPKKRDGTRSVFNCSFSLFYHIPFVFTIYWFSCPDVYQQPAINLPK